MSALITIENLSKIYRGQNNTTHALDGVSFNINRGEVFGLLGVNGAGKTTLSSILATLHPPTSGDVLFNGVSIYKDLVTYRRALGFCPQKANLDTFLNVRDNLVFAGRYFLLPEVEIQTRVDQLLKDLHLEKYADFDIHALSGGTKQRVLIARSLVHNPSLVILDEPTVGLDPGVRRNLWDLIKELRTRGITVILTTHYLDEAEVLSDRVCILSKGKVLTIQTPAELKEASKKATLEEVFIELTNEEAI
jgi:ABC-2 type transport system ATP-binding protein